MFARAECSPVPSGDMSVGSDAGLDWTSLEASSRRSTETGSGAPLFGTPFHSVHSEGEAVAIPRPSPAHFVLVRCGGPDDGSGERVRYRYHWPATSAANSTWPV